jgi:hypothetical protein
MQEGRYTPHVHSSASKSQDWERTLTPTLRKKALKGERDRERERERVEAAMIRIERAG